MKTGKTELPRSTSGADEFFILQGKKQGVRIEGEGYVIREFSYSDCESLAENADNNKIWNNLMDNFPHPYTKQDAFDYISMVKAMPGKPMRFAIEVEGKAVGSIGFGSEGDVERVTAEVGKNLDSFIKKAGAYTVVDLELRTQSLEEFFMHFYGEGAEQ